MHGAGRMGEMRKAGYLVLALLIAVSCGVSCRVSSAEPKSELRTKAVKETVMGARPALVRLEDVSVWYAFHRNGLAVLRSVADYLHAERVPFHVSLIPCFKDPARGLQLSIADVQDPRARDFNEALRYMVAHGAVIGLHGYTHQCGGETSGAGFEFALDGPLARAKYAAARIKKAVALAEKAGLPITYWETPHYTASVEQYREFARYYRIMYEPDPHNRATGRIALALLGGQVVCFVPTPLGMVSGAADVGRILRELDERPQELASFFFHPFREYQFTRNPTGSVTFHLDRPNGYLRALVGEMKARGYRFVRVDELVQEVTEAAQKHEKTDLYYTTALSGGP